jgi:NAD(P)H-dependent flavin oxidoreductase YrpB (nitropropane dioxygenase family)
VAATCNAGGFGFLAGATIPPESLEREILQGEGADRRSPSASTSTCTSPTPPTAWTWWSATACRGELRPLPGPDFTVRKLKEAGVVCMPTVGALKHALKAVELGADAVTVQGGEGGGHTGAVPTTMLLPAGGRQRERCRWSPPAASRTARPGGRLAWGAEGIAMGTRFLMTRTAPTAAGHPGALSGLSNPARHHRLDRHGRHAASA